MKQLLLSIIIAILIICVAIYNSEKPQNNCHHEKTPETKTIQYNNFVVALFYLNGDRDTVNIHLNDNTDEDPFNICTHRGSYWFYSPGRRYAGVLRYKILSKF